MKQSTGRDRNYAKICPRDQQISMWFLQTLFKNNIRELWGDIFEVLTYHNFSHLFSSRLLRKEAVWVHSLGENIPVAITFLNKLKWVLDRKSIQLENSYYPPRAELSEDQLEVQTWCQTWEGFSDNWEYQVIFSKEGLSSWSHILCFRARGQVSTVAFTSKLVTKGPGSNN